MRKLVVLVLVLAALCRGDKDVLLRGQASPVFSSSIDSIPVSGSSTNQQSVYSKSPGLISLSSASASASSSGYNTGSAGNGGRNQWYSQGSSVNAGFGGESGGDGGYLNSQPATSGGYRDTPQQPPAQQQVSSSATIGDHSGAGAYQQGPSYTYHYQHYPTSSNHGWSEESGGGGFGDVGGLQIPGLDGIGGPFALKKGLGIAGLIAKGVLAIKPFLILGLLLLIAFPVLFLLLPIPIITITGQRSPQGTGRSSQIASYLSQLSGKVLNSEECLERIICKMPHAPEKYQSKAKLVWDEYGSHYVSNSRVVRGLNAYFETSSQKNKNLKCDQRFKCTNKYL